MKRLLFWAILVSVFSVAAYPQPSKTVVAAGGFRSELVSSDGPRVQTYELDSRLMGRKLPFGVLLPESYSNKESSGRIYPVAYLLHGLTGHFDNWTKRTELIGYANGHDVIIVTPEGGNGWYTDSVTVPNDKYESYIIQELIPEIDNRFRTIADRRGRVIAGLSMGGYGAIKFGLKYPGMFKLVGSFSDALGSASYSEKKAGAIGKGIDTIFGPDDSETRKANDVFKLVRELTPEKTKTLPFIYQSCGTEDFLFKSNHEFLVLLVEKKIPHEYREHPGGHDWTFWNVQVKEFLEVADSRLKK